MSKVAPTVEIREAFPFSTRDYDVAYSSAPIVFELPAQPGAFVRLNEVDFVTTMEVAATFAVSAQAVTSGCTAAVRGGTVGDYTQYSFQHLRGLSGYFDRIRISTATGVILEELDGVAYAAAMRAAFLRSSEIDQQARMEGTCVETNPNAFVVYKAGPITTPCGYTDIDANTFRVTQSIEARFRFSSLPSTIMAETVMPLAAGLRIEIMLRDVSTANSPQISGYHGQTGIETSRQLSALTTAADVATAETTYGFKSTADVSSSTGIAVGTRCRVINAGTPTEYGSTRISAVAVSAGGILELTVNGGAIPVGGGAIADDTQVTFQAATGFISVASPAADTDGGLTLADQKGQGVVAVPIVGVTTNIPFPAAQKDFPGSLASGQSVIGSGARFSAFNQWGLYVGRLVLVSYATANNQYTFIYRRITAVSYTANGDVYQITLNAATANDPANFNQTIVSLHSVVDVAPTYAVALRNCRIEYPIYRASGETKFQLNVISVRSEQQSGLATGTSASLQVASTAMQCLACDVLVADEPNGSITTDQIVSYQPLINGTALLPQPTETQSAQLMRFIDQAYMIASDNMSLSKSVKSPFTMIGRGNRLSRDFPYFAPRMTVPLDNRSLITNRLRIAINRSAAGNANAQYYIYLRIVKSIMFDGSNVTVMA
jgi:hypothetical protein